MSIGEITIVFFVIFFILVGIILFGCARLLMQRMW